jgi:protein disulfide-isomerase
MIRTPRLKVKQPILAAVLGVTALVGMCQAQIPWTHDYDAAQAASASSGAVMLLHFYSDDCVPCKMLDARAFQDPSLITAIKRTVIPVKINTGTHPEIAKKYSVNRWPTDVYIAADGTELVRTVSPQKTADYIAVLDRVAVRNRDHFVVAQAGETNTKELEIHREPPNKLAGQTRNHFSTGTLTDQDPYATPADTYKATSPMAAALGSSVIQAAAATKTPAPNPIAASVPVAEIPPALAPNAVSPENASTARAPRETIVENLFCAAQPENDKEYIETRRSLSDEAQPSGPSVGATTQNSSTHLNPFASQVKATLTLGPNMSSTSQVLEREVQTATAPESGPAMRGYCPVSLDEKGVWMIGDARFAVRHRGRVYYLASRECQQKFLQVPDRYAPILSGFDLVHFLHTGELRDGLREYGCWFKGRVYLFASAENRDFFDEHVVEFATTAEALQNPGGLQPAGNSTPNSQTQPQEKLDPSQGRIATEPRLPTLAR